MITFPARKSNMYKICNLRKAIFFVFYNILPAKVDSSKSWFLKDIMEIVHLSFIAITNNLQGPLATTRIFSRKSKTLIYLTFQDLYAFRNKITIKVHKVLPL